MAKNKNKLRQQLEAYLSIEKIKLVPNSFDVVGHIAILEFPDELKKEKKIIAKVLLDVHSNIKTVLEKCSERKGTYRNREYKFLAGLRKFETLHKEYGCVFKLNPTKVYFSPRELTERQRIAEQVKQRERVLVMFSGVGPYGIIIAKRQPATEVVCVEINKAAVAYAKENVRLNKLGNIKNYCGDARKICPRLGKFDRIIMPLPLGAENFLDVAFACSQKNTVVHFYNWGEEVDNTLFANGLAALRAAAKQARKKIKILKKKKMLPYSPRKWKVCIDFAVLGKAGVAKSGQRRRTRKKN